MKAPKVVDVAIDEKPTTELTVDHVQVFGMNVDCEQVLRPYRENPRCESRGHNPGETWQASCKKHEKPEGATGVASMIIRVPEGKCDTSAEKLWRNGLFVRQTQRANQEH